MDTNTTLERRAPGNVLMQQKLMMCLAAIAGFCDSYGLIHFKTFVSFMSGNTTATGFALGKQDFPGALIAFTAIAFFCIGILISSLLSDRRWYRAGWMPFIFVASLLALCASLVVLCHLNGYAGVAFLSFAIGYLNNSLTHVGGQSVNPDFVTGNLNNSMKHLASAIRGKELSDAKGPWDTHRLRSGLLLSVWFCFLAGAALCVVTGIWLGDWTMAPVILVLLFCPIFIRKRQVPLV